MCKSSHVNYIDEMKTAAVIIPVYKPLPDADETFSLNQCLSVLRQHPIIFVGPEGVDCRFYASCCEKHDVVFRMETFDTSYFDDIAGYNRLLLSEGFYRRFSHYAYILIYQLDAFVFRDDFLDWCSRGYDYVGAPIIGEFGENIYSELMTERVGNGGLSLRRIQAYLSYFEGRRLVLSPKQVYQRLSVWKKPYTRFFVWILMCLGWKNRPSSFAASWRYNEDDFWSGTLDGTRYALRKPSVKEAMMFSYEKYPSVLFTMMGALPFGCHAWRKYEYEPFWKEILAAQNKTAECIL